MAFTCCSPDAREQLRVSKAIDLELVQWKRDAKPEFKVLLVGTAIPPMVHWQVGILGIQAVYRPYNHTGCPALPRTTGKYAL